VGGFLRPDPPVPVIIGGFGSKMAELAGRVGDGMNVPGGPSLQRLIATAREAHAAAGRDTDQFVVTASSGASPREREMLEKLGVDRVVVYVRPPYTDGVARVAQSL
jgi:alkanesulfonate monooxygenase SsuD/methylene tetrahydromethanopterin reductase-like flavin-dependent oxidoreductase (luciferase family)